MLTGSFVEAVGAGPANQTWEDVCRSARLASVFDTMGQTPTYSGRAVGSVLFPAPSPRPQATPYYQLSGSTTHGAVIRTDVFLPEGSTGALVPVADQASGGRSPEVALRQVAATATTQTLELAGVGLPPERRGVVLRSQGTGLPPLTVWAGAGDRPSPTAVAGEPSPEATAELKRILSSWPFVRLVETPGEARYKAVAWLIGEGTQDTLAFLWTPSLAFSWGQFCNGPRPIDATIARLEGALHYLRAAQGAAVFRNRAPAFRVSLGTTRQIPLYRHDQAVVVRVSAGRPCYVAALAADSRGRLVPLRSAAGSCLVRVGSGPVELTLPSDYGQWLAGADDVCLTLVKAFAFTDRPSAEAPDHA